VRKVGWLKKELEKFPDDADCYAYEGEVIGIVVCKKENDYEELGVIHCSESDDEHRNTSFINKLKGE